MRNSPFFKATRRVFAWLGRRRAGRPGKPQDKKVGACIFEAKNHAALVARFDSNVYRLMVNLNIGYAFYITILRSP
jgi:hypothetical protein